MQNNEIQQLAFIPTFGVLAKTEVAHKHLRNSILPAVLFAYQKVKIWL